MTLKVTQRHKVIYIGWQWRNCFISAAVFLHFVRKAPRNVCYSAEVSRYGKMQTNCILSALMNTRLPWYRSCHGLCPAPFKLRLPYSYLAKWRPQRGCLPVTSSPPDSALTRQVHCLACTYRVRALSGGDDVTARQPDYGRDFAS